MVSVERDRTSGVALGHLKCLPTIISYYALLHDLLISIGSMNTLETRK